MSRYVELSIDGRAFDRSEVMHVIDNLGLVSHWAEAGESVMLEGTLECAGEPVNVRVAAGALGSVEDFGFRERAGVFHLVCGDIDRALLHSRLIEALQRHRATLAVLQSLDAEHFATEAVEQDASGTRIVLIRRPS